MKKRVILIIAFVLGTGISAMMAQQQWTSAQQEVWKNVNDYWALMAKGDINGFLDYIHPDYVGWDNDSPLPSTKEESVKMIKYFWDGVKIPLYQINPLAIKVYGDVAFVHYYYYRVMISPDGKKSNEQGRWTDILLKQGGKWVMIGDHGGANK